MFFYQYKQKFNSIFLCFLFSIFFVALLSGCIVNQNRFPSTINQEAIIVLERAKGAFYSQNYSLSYALLEKILESGDPEVLYFLALTIRQLPSSASHKKRFITLLEDASSKKYPPAMWELGQAYSTGYGVVKDVLLGIHWEDASSREGNKKLKAPTYYVTNNAVTTEISFSKHLMSLRDKAINSDVSAQLALAKYYNEGFHVPVNQDKAFYWYKKSALNSSLSAMLKLGYFYCNGIGTEVNKTKANYWLVKSKRQVICSKTNK